MTAETQIEFLKDEANKIQSGIDDKKKQINLLKGSIKVEERRLKAAQEGIEYYQSQIK